MHRGYFATATAKNFYFFRFSKGCNLYEIPLKEKVCKQIKPKMIKLLVLVVGLLLAIGMLHSTVFALEKQRYLKPRGGNKSPPKLESEKKKQNDSEKKQAKKLPQRTDPVFRILQESW